MAIAAVSVAIWTKTIGASHAADAPAPSAAKLERITEFFNHEVATGKLPGADELTSRLDLAALSREIAGKTPSAPALASND